MKVVFLGTPEAAVPTLEALVAAGHDVALVITRPDRRRGRGSAMMPSPVKAAAERLGLTVAHSVRDLDDVTAELGIVVAYGAMIPGAVLERLPMLNVHFSLLPRWRGAAPVERAILAGDNETGVGIMGLEVTLDTGPLFAEARTPIDRKSAAELTAELAAMGAELLVTTLATPDWSSRSTPQTGEATYAEKLSPATFRLDAAHSAQEADRIVRLGRAWCEVAGKRFRVLAASPSSSPASPGVITKVADDIVMGCADGGLALHMVQPEGGRPMSASSWWQGARAFDGTTWS